MFHIPLSINVKYHLSQDLISKSHFCQKLNLGNCLVQGILAPLLILKSGDLRKPIPYHCYHYASVPWVSIEKVTSNLFLFALYTALLSTLPFVHSYVYPIQIATSIQNTQQIPNKKARFLKKKKKKGNDTQKK